MVSPGSIMVLVLPDKLGKLKSSVVTELERS
jgi:hypothetical protein